MRTGKEPLTRTSHIISCTIHVRPSFISRMRVIAHDLAATSVSEEGCIAFLAAESPETEGLFLITSAWTGSEAYERHRASAYVRAFESQIVPEILAEPVRLQTWQKIG